MFRPPLALRDQHVPGSGREGDRFRNRRGLESAQGEPFSLCAVARLRRAHQRLECRLIGAKLARDSTDANGRV
jgi:hypothetical protein